MKEAYAVDVLPDALARFLDDFVDTELAIMDVETFQRVDPGLVHPRLSTFPSFPLLVNYGPSIPRRLMHVGRMARLEGHDCAKFELGKKSVWISAVELPGSRGIAFVMHPTGHIGEPSVVPTHSPNRIYRAQALPSSALTWAEPAFLEHLGLGPDVEGVTLTDLVHPDCRESATETWFDTLTNGMASTRVMFKNGSETGIWFQSVSSLDLENNDLVNLIFIDVTEDVRTSAMLELHEQEFVGLAETVPLGIFRADARGKLLYVNDRFCELFGVSEGSEMPVEKSTTVDGEPLIDAVRQAFEMAQDLTIDAQIELEGRLRFVRLRLRRVTHRDGTAEVVGSAEDITIELERNAKLAQEALTDAVSGVGNRRALELDLERRLTVTEEPFAVLLCDLDGFKQVNDSLGHQAGDQVIASVGERLTNLARSQDLVCRLGGDEFIVVAGGIDNYEAALEFAERILPELRRPYDCHDSQIELSGSIGVAVAKRNTTVLGILQMADHAMYEAKRTGRNQVRPYQSADQTTALSPLALRRDLRRAIAADKLDLAFQPIFALEDETLERPRGAEALLRWTHPVMGNVPPSVLIPVAEQSGLIPDLGEWVMNAAVKAVSEINTDLTADEMVTVSINLSALQLSRRDFVPGVQAVLDMHDVTAGEIMFELTETYLVDQVDGARDALDELNELGVALAVDDFGTGFATLEYLLSLPVQAVKIDHSFTQRIASKRGNAMLRGITSGCRELGMLVVVEGIENEELLDAARRAGATHAQGYHLGRPISIEGHGNDAALAQATLFGRAGAAA